MSKRTLPALLVAGLVSLAALTACTTGNDPAADPVTESEETVTEAATTDDPADTADTEPTETDPADTAPTDTDETPAESDPADTAPAETETRAPRYDYMTEDVAQNVTIDAAAYRDIRLTLPASLQITDEDVAAYIDYICFDYRTPDNGETHMTDQPLKLGDDAYIYYKGIMDGEEFRGGSNWEAEAPHCLGLGSGSFIPGFEEGLVGVIPANATKESPAEIRVTFPESYGNELAGRDATFYVAVEYAVAYTLPTYNRDFVENTLKYDGQKEFYAGDRAYLEEFEAFVRERLEAQRAKDVESARLEALWKHLMAAASCTNLPQIELDYYFGAYMGEIEYYYAYYQSSGGASFTETYPTLDAFACAYIGAAKDADWRAELTDTCRELVKKDMLLHAIAEREGMETVTEEEFKAELTSWVDYYQGYMGEAEVIEYIGEEAIRESAFLSKMQTWLLGQTTYTYEAAASTPSDPA